MQQPGTGRLNLLRRCIVSTVGFLLTLNQQVRGFLNVSGYFIMTLYT